MRHRVITNFNAEADGITSDEIIATLLDEIPVESSVGDLKKNLDSVLPSHP